MCSEVFQVSEDALDLGGVKKQNSADCNLLTLSGEISYFNISVWLLACSFGGCGLWWLGPICYMVGGPPGVEWFSVPDVLVPWLMLRWAAFAGVCCPQHKMSREQVESQTF